MPSKVVATESEAKVSQKPKKVITAVSDGSEESGSDSTDIIASTPTQDKVESVAPTPESDTTAKNEPSKLTLPTSLPPPAPDQIRPNAANADQARQGYFDQANSGNAAQFLQALNAIQSQYQGKLSDTVEASDADSDARTAAMNRATTDQRSTMRSNEETRGKEYGQFIGEERGKADARQQEWADNEVKMNEARKLLNDFYTGEQEASKTRANDWNTFTTDEKGKAETRGNEWKTFMQGEGDKANTRQSTFDNTLGQMNQQLVQRGNDWANFLAQEQAAASDRQSSFQTRLDSLKAPQASMPSGAHIGKDGVPYIMVRGRNGKMKKVKNKHSDAYMKAHGKGKYKYL